MSHKAVTLLTSEGTMNDRISSPEPDRTSGVAYGQSNHYTGEKGRIYQERKNGLPLAQVARIHATKFSPAIQKTDTVVDFGCGSGEILAAIDCGRKIGIEVNPRAREQALNAGIECYTDASQVSQGIADVIISHHVLEHVPYPIQALKELRKALKPEGTLVICVPAENPRKTKNIIPMMCLIICILGQSNYWGIPFSRQALR